MPSHSERPTSTIEKVPDFKGNVVNKIPSPAKPSAGNVHIYIDSGGLISLYSASNPMLLPCIHLDDIDQQGELR